MLYCFFFFFLLFEVPGSVSFVSCHRKSLSANGNVPVALGDPRTTCVTSANGDGFSIQIGNLFLSSPSVDSVTLVGAAASPNETWIIQPADKVQGFLHEVEGTVF
jgi:hypothetical protein